MPGPKPGALPAWRPPIKAHLGSIKAAWRGNKCPRNSWIKTLLTAALQLYHESLLKIIRHNTRVLDRMRRQLTAAWRCGRTLFSPAHVRTATPGAYAPTPPDMIGAIQAMRSGRASEPRLVRDPVMKWMLFMAVFTVNVMISRRLTAIAIYQLQILKLRVRGFSRAWPPRLSLPAYGAQCQGLAIWPNAENV